MTTLGLDQFNESWREFKNGSELVSIVFLNNNVDFYPDYYNDFSISIFDFKEIILGWKSFLSETPLSRSKARNWIVV